MLKAAMTLDGKVATETGDSKWISGPESRALAHRWRSEADAVAVGIGTVLADDPQLTARLVTRSREPADAGERGRPQRVVFDSMARLPLQSRLVGDAPEVPLTVVVSRAAPRAANEALETAGAEVLIATGGNEPARVASALDQLGAAGITSILLEGGPHLTGAFLDAGEVDELRLFVAPLVLGGRGARAPVEGEGAETIADAVRALTVDCETIGDDLLVAARLREW
jgi:diaminohydroxyphosphoribosylaminopyrimidine deaminase/5-amino-6-(5-phosphoribosylamino)uracil reductase